MRSVENVGTIVTKEIKRAKLTMVTKITTGAK
jgi:hypothetical protein